MTIQKLTADALLAGTITAASIGNGEITAAKLASTLDLSTKTLDIGNATGTVSSIANHSTTNLSEGTNLYYTNARVDTYASSGSLSSLQTTGDVTIGGNLTVNGTTTTINSTNLAVDDVNITLASGAATSVAADGAGLTVDGANATLTYVASGDKWSFNKTLDVPGLTATTADINGGTIDGVVIGGATPAAITGTTGTFSSNLTVDTSTLVVSASLDSVGIGTTVPTNFSNLYNGLTVGGTKRALLTLRDASENDVVYLVVTSGGHTELETTGQGDFRTKVSGGFNYTISTANTERMRIDSSGRVGIGTSSPSHNLEVRSSGSTTVGVSSSGATSLFRGFAVTEGSTEYASFKQRFDNGEVRITAGLSGWGGYTTFHTNGAERLRITSTGSVGIGTSSPAVKLTSQLTSSGISGIASTAAALFENSGNSDVVIAAGATSKSRIAFGDSGDWIVGRIDYDHSDNSMRFGTAGSGERMRIDSSGNLLVGKTNNDDSGSGVRVRNDGLLQATRANADPLSANRTGTDGAIAAFRKDGVIVGVLGADTATTVSNSMTLDSGSDGVVTIDGIFRVLASKHTGAPRIAPVGDNVIDVGNGGARFKNLYLSSGIYAGGGFGSSGQVLTSDGSTSTWQDATGAGLYKGDNGERGDIANGAGDIFRINKQVLTTNVTIDADENASCAGPLTVATGVTLVVNGNLTVV